MRQCQKVYKQNLYLVLTNVSSIFRVMGRIQIADNGSRKDIIIRKAAVLFREKGYKATSMRELSEVL